MNIDPETIMSLEIKDKKRFLENLMKHMNLQLEKIKVLKKIEES